MVGLTVGFFFCVQLVILSWIFILYTWLVHVLLELILTKIDILELRNSNLKSNMTFLSKFGIPDYYHIQFSRVHLPAGQVWMELKRPQCSFVKTV
jgi:hypothetical protein